MSEGITSGVLRAAVLRICDRLEGCAAELNDLDARLGDGDLGTTLSSIARALRAEAPDFPDDVGAALARMVAAIAATSGSSFSAVAMTGLHRAAGAVTGCESISWEALPRLLVLAQDSMAARGGARLGDKSVLDALAAVADAIAEERDHARYAIAADAALGDTLAAFRDRPCRIGRARLAASRSVGQDDPGMVALKRIVEAVSGTVDSDPS